jgi:hypothetical protein
MPSLPNIHSLPSVASISYITSIASLRKSGGDARDVDNITLNGPAIETSPAQDHKVREISGQDMKEQPSLTSKLQDSDKNSLEKNFQLIAEQTLLPEDTVRVDGGLTQVEAPPSDGEIRTDVNEVRDV